jgi:hypothetical protein
MTKKNNTNYDKTTAKEFAQTEQLEYAEFFYKNAWI